MKKAIWLLCLTPLIASAKLIIIDDTLEMGMSATKVAQPTSDIERKPQIQPIPPKEIWTAEVGSTLRETIEKWSAKAKWTVEWDTKTDYPIRGPLRFEGDFDQAVSQFIKLYERAERPLVADVSPRQRLIYVTNRN